MKKIIFIFTALLICLPGFTAEKIGLPDPSRSRGSDIMDAFRNRRSSREYKAEPLSAQDLGDLLWAARGVNRENGKLTSPTAQNSQDVDVYVCTVNGVFLYNAKDHSLDVVTEVDIRPLVEGRRPTGAPVCLLIVSDMSRYGGYSKEGDNTHFYEMGAVDSGIVSQNISLFCAGAGLATVPKAGMDQQAIRKALGLTVTQFLWLNHPVGYPAD